jgi:glycosyltransferase involved in cell wall biosynthesis
MVVVQLGPYPPPHGGVQTNLLSIREHLRRHGISAPVINLTRHRRAQGDEVYYPTSALQVAQLLATMPADIIHLHLGGRLTARLLGLCLLCTLMPNRRVVLTCHSGGYPAMTATRTLRRLSVRTLVFRRLDAVIAVNEEIASLFEKLGVARSRIHLISPYSPVGVRDDVRLPDQLQEFGSAHEPLLTTVGLLEPEYDLPLQIKALETVRRTFPRAGLVIVGSGSLESDMRRLIASSAERDHVLLCGDVPHPVTLRLISESDVFLRTTLYDGDSVSVREALQLGVPVIATDNGMRPDGVQLVPRSNAAALHDAIAMVLSRPAGALRTNSLPEGSLDEVLELYTTLADRMARFRAPRHSDS